MMTRKEATKECAQGGVLSSTGKIYFSAFLTEEAQRLTTHLVSSKRYHERSRPGKMVEVASKVKIFKREKLLLPREDYLARGGGVEESQPFLLPEDDFE